LSAGALAKEEAHAAVNFGVPFGEGTDGGQFVFLQLAGQKSH